MDHKLIDDITDYTGRVHASVTFSRRPAPGVQRQRVKLPDIHGDTVEVADALRALADRLSTRADEPAVDTVSDDGSRYIHVIIAKDHAAARAYASRLPASYSDTLLVTTRAEAGRIIDTAGVRYAVHVVPSLDPLAVAAVISAVDRRFASLALPGICDARDL